MPADTKTALLNSAEKAARRFGFDGFSYADLADEVGIRKASIHHHFPTKAALSVALMERYHAKVEAACARIDSAGGTGAERLSALIAFYREALGDGTSLCLCVSLSTSRDSLPAEVIAQMGRFRVMIIGWLQTLFERARTDTSIAGVTHPAQEAAATLSLLEGAQLAARAEENIALFDTALALMHQRIGMD